MQYEITLPADYDMEIIRTRVATRGHLLDAFPGLGLKAYCVRERGVDGSPVNQYAPFYLWAAASGQREFLFGPGFRGLSVDFGRPVVQQWTGVTALSGPDHGAFPHTATKHTEVIAPDADLTDLIEQSTEDTRRLAATPGVHTTALAVNPHGWELLRFTLWTTPPAVDGVHYQVHHLSTPHLPELLSN
ncbi:DUF4865 family protein [Allokutzneria oryzae]|uniref:DUF4865 family protein n=1 Tax=Allokutzneria oryzae TaxID=1378989 RepID=A0ABV5ZXJ4_9PSEU